MPTTRHLVPVEAWEDPRQRLGLWGEQVALAYLTDRGWAVEAHRFRFGRQEIDLIVRHTDLVAFVEVKTRRSAEFGSGLEAVDWRKRRVLARVAGVWSLRHGRPSDAYRFDVIGIEQYGKGQVQITHIEDAWRT